MTVRRALPLVFAPMIGPMIAGACDAEVPPRRGEVIVAVDTDLPVPELASRMRLDVYQTDGTWLDSREVFLGNVDDWPASFSFVHPTDEGGAYEALLRVRVFPEGATRRYEGEPNTGPEPFEPLVPPSTLGELCASAPTLPIGGSVTVRRGRYSIVPAWGSFLGSTECQEFGNYVGSAAAHVEIEKAGRYEFGVIDVSPTLPAAPDSLLPQVTLELRRDCEDNDSGVVCTYGMLVLPNGYAQPFYASVEAELEPGRYALVTGGVLGANGVADITLAAWSEESPFLSSTPAPVPEEPLGPWLDGDPNRTPAVEPDPLRAVDRLFRVSVEPHRRTYANVVLHGDCLGRPALLSNVPGEVDLARALTCTDDPSTLVAPERVTTPADPAVRLFPESVRSRAGTFATDEPCEETDSDERVVCVPSGAMVLGSGGLYDEAGLGAKARTAAFHRFFLDRYELTVADYRNDILAGLTLPPDDAAFPNPSQPTNPDAIQSTEQLCTFSEESLGREALPLTCISWYGARAWCRFRGGDLPTSAQWEYAALRAGHARKTIYPWGETFPSCACDGTDPTCRAEVVERDPFDRDTCIAEGFGPAPAWEIGGELGDTSPLGVVGMAGNVREWTLDSALPLDHACYGATPWDPICWEPEAPTRVQRGGSFVQWATPSTSTFFWQPAAFPYDAGVRCVYAAKP